MRNKKILNLQLAKRKKYDASTARQYDYFVEHYPMYKNLASFLIDKAQLKSGMSVIDIGCGTGVAMPFLKKKVGKNGKIIGVDRSLEMLKIAKERSSNKDITFFNISAEKIHITISENVDRVISSAAFWQMNTGKTLDAIHIVLKKDGKFIFNLSQGKFNFTRGSFSFRLTGEYAKLKDITNIMIEIAKQNGMPLPEKKRQPPLPDLEKVKEELAEHQFVLEKYHLFEKERSAKETYEFLKIPEFTKHIAPELSYEERMILLDKAYRRFDKSRKFLTRFICFVAKPIR